jgi:hypothetical protein
MGKIQLSKASERGRANCHVWQHPKIIQSAFQRWLTSDKTTEFHHDRFAANCTSLKVMKEACYEDADEADAPSEMAIGKEDIKAGWIYKHMTTYCWTFWLVVMRSILPIFAVLSLITQDQSDDFTTQTVEVPKAIAALEKLAEPDQLNAWMKAADELAGDGAAAGHPKCQQPSHPSRTRTFMKKKAALVALTLASKLEPLAKVLPWQAALEGWVNFNKFPPEVKPSGEPTHEALAAYFEPHLAVLEEKFGGHVWEKGRLRIAFLNFAPRILTAMKRYEGAVLKAVEEEWQLARGRRQSMQLSG